MHCIIMNADAYTLVKLQMHDAWCSSSPCVKYFKAGKLANRITEKFKVLKSQSNKIENLKTK